MNVQGLIDIVANQKQHPRRALAIQLLKFVEQERASFAEKYAGYGHEEFRQNLGEMMLGSNIELVWRSLKELVTVKDKDGVERLALSKESRGNIERILAESRRNAPPTQVATIEADFAD